MSINKAQLQTLSARLTTAVNGLSPLDDGKNVDKRQGIIAVAREILQEATLPEEEWLAEVALMCIMTASRLFLRWGAFDGIPVKGTVAYNDLAEKLEIDASLFRRVGKVLVTGNVLHEVDDAHLAHTAKSLAYANSGPYSFLARMTFDETLKSCAFLPEYFEEYRDEPQGPVGCPYSFAHGQPEKSLWDIMNKNPERMRIFMQAMKTAESQMPATVLYDFGWAKEMARSTDRMLFVDVGGGKGHVVQGICEENPWLPKEKCAVQDREDVIQEARMADNPNLRGVKMMAHDFNLEQPIKGALVYHIRRCLHNYGDEISVGILRHIADAMAPDSRLLIVEQVIANPPLPMEAQFDFVMMTLGGKERTERQFEDLVEQAGLRILDIHRKPNTPISVVECIKS
ncbi:hypothetical protein AK830_g9965 [Neonectria ditissima]|uniref:O-methyltransferase C-terminal domain-containing protein n=1 Tax=Neonectria ditissima TaxID=78410 RepID=A0A0P7AR09_9HYPO|nr:hypothetical protein AK830_g9965 [Neonectria ditissima]